MLVCLSTHFISKFSHCCPSVCLSSQDQQKPEFLCLYQNTKGGWGGNLCIHNYTTSTMSYPNKQNKSPPRPSPPSPKLFFSFSPFTPGGIFISFPQLLSKKSELSYVGRSLFKGIPTPPPLCRCKKKNTRRRIITGNVLSFSLLSFFIPIN